MAKIDEVEARRLRKRTDEGSRKFRKMEVEVRKTIRETTERAKSIVHKQKLQEITRDISKNVRSRGFTVIKGGKVGLGGIGVQIFEKIHGPLIRKRKRGPET